MSNSRFLIPCLSALGHESGFAIRVDNATRVRIRTYQRQTPVDVYECAVDESSTSIRMWRSDWTTLPQDDAELYSVEVVGTVSRGLEGELLFRHRQGLQVASVLTGMMPCREPGFKFTPILHQAHYNILTDDVETICILANLIGEHLQFPASNRFQIEVRDLSGRVLATAHRDLRFNATELLNIRQTIEELGIVPDNGASVRVRGGSSQFVVFTAYHHRRTHALGLEHSLPPIYFTEAPMNPRLRERYLAAAFRDLR